MKDPLSGGRIHIIGLGGIGMSAIAEVMTSRGLTVQGSDQKDNANLRRLAAKGIKVFVGHQPSNLEGASCAVISTAVKDGNPELEAARGMGLPIFCRADTLAALMRGYRTISVTGSHGKTTTTAMVAWILERAGLDPTALVGGVLCAWNSNARIGASRWMVVEADESDGTFIKLPTEIGVVTNIDPEHLDYYGTEAALHAAFETFFRQIPEDGLAVCGIDHPVVRAIASEIDAPNMMTFGCATDANVRIENVYSNGGSVAFDVRINDLDGHAVFRKKRVELSVPGAHNALNAAAAITVAHRAGIDIDAAIAAISTFEGVERRFTLTGDWNGVTIYDDYAHHPAEIEAALSAARGAAKRHVIAIMQPHRFSRLKSLFEAFCACFREADTVLVAPVYSAGEAPNGFDRDKLVEGIRRTGHTRVYPIEGEASLAPTVAAIARPGDLVIGLGAGNISEWARALPAQLSLTSTYAGAAE